MSKAKSILMNPYLLGMNGFVAGALLLWASPQLAQNANPPVATSTVQLVPPVS